MSTYKFSLLANNHHQLFNPSVDILNFDLSTITASAVRLVQSGSNLSLTYGGKTISLDAVGIDKLAADPAANITFANGSNFGIGDGTTNTLADYSGQYYDLSTSTVGNQIWGLGGADEVQTGSGADWLVGNGALTPLNHVSRAGTVGGNQSSNRATISADGNFVAFESSSTNLIAGHTADINIKNMSTSVISNEAVSAAGLGGNSGQGFPVISADGLWIAFQGNSSNLIPGSAPSGMIYVASTTTNSIEAVTTTAGNVFANRAGSAPDISGDGRYVAFSSVATNLATGSASDYEDIFVKDRQTGEVLRISTSTTGGDGNGDSQYAKISADGRWVAFQSFASNLTTNDTNGYPDIFVWDRTDNSLTNLTKDIITTVISNPNSGNYLPDIASNGDTGVVVFQTARNLVAQDTSNGTDIYAYNSNSNTLQLVSSKADGTGVQLGSEDASVSGDGRFVVFTSYSDQLVPGDTNSTRDIFVKDLFTGQIALVSKTAGGLASNGPSMRAQISLGGEWIVFESSATNLSTTDGNGGFPDVFRFSNPLLKDTLIGGAGNDTYVLSRADIVQEQVNGGIDTIQSSISYSLVDTDGSGLLGGNVENLRLTGTSNLNGIGNALNNIITGNAGNNVLNGGDGIDTVSYSAATAAVTVNLALTTIQITGGAGSDTLTNIENLTGSVFADTLTGNAGNNRLDGGLGNDTLIGGIGDDTYIVDSNADAPNEGLGAGGAGIDTVISSVSWVLQSTLENLTLSGVAAINGGGNQAANLLTGNAAANILNGYAGNDTLNGGAGTDTLIGGDGSDTYLVDNAGDIISETNAIASTGGIDLVQSYISYSLVDTDGAGVNGGNVENLGLMGTAALNGTGNALDNVLYANTGNNVLNGGTAGVDTVSYLYGALANIGVTVSLLSSIAQNTIGSGSDTLVSIENLTGSNNGDSLTGNSLNNILDGGNGNDVLTGDTGNDTLNGGAGNDILSGGAGIDFAEYLGSTAGVTVNLALTTQQNTGGSGLDTLSSIEQLEGSNFNDILTGNGLDNVLFGGNGNDTLSGAVGNDILNGGIGIDTMIGGDGSDTSIVDNAGDLVIESNAIASGIDLVWSYITYSLVDTDGTGLNGGNVENLRLLGTTALNGTGNALDNVLYANTGNNVLDGGTAGIDTVSYLYGALTNTGVTVSLVSTSPQTTIGSGSDSLVSIENLTGSNNGDNLTGNGLNNILDGGNGNDELTGGAGNDILNGGDGIDVAKYGSATVGVTVNLTVTTQQNTVGAGLDTLSSIEKLDGSSFNDTLSGNALANSLDGYSGNDTLNGGDGNDSLGGGAGNDILNGGVGIDEAYYGDAIAGVAVNLALITQQNTGGDGLDTLISIEQLEGSNFNDTLTGNTLDNTLSGGNGNDTLSGGAGVDILIGGAGKDTLSGGTGNDLFKSNAVGDLGLASTSDVITDFVAGQDKIDLSLIDTNTGLAGDQAFTFVTTAFSAAGQVSYSAGVISINTDADAAAEYQIQLTGIVPASLSAGNFVL